MAGKRVGILAATLSICMLSLAAPEARALPVPALDHATVGLTVLIQVQSRIGYWRKRQEQADMKRYRGKPGAQRVLRQQRRNLCRNVPEMC